MFMIGAWGCSTAMSVMFAFVEGTYAVEWRVAEACCLRFGAKGMPASAPDLGCGGRESS